MIGNIIKHGSLQCKMLLYKAFFVVQCMNSKHRAKVLFSIKFMDKGIDQL